MCAHCSLHILLDIAYHLLSTILDDVKSKPTKRQMIFYSLLLPYMQTSSMLNYSPIICIQLFGTLHQMECPLALSVSYFQMKWRLFLAQGKILIFNAWAKNEIRRTICFISCLWMGYIHIRCLRKKAPATNCYHGIQQNSKKNAQWSGMNLAHKMK